MSAIQCVSETTVRCLPAIKLCFYWVMAQNHFELVYIRRDREDFKNSERNAFGFLVSESDKIFILFLLKKAINKYTAQKNIKGTLEHHSLLNFSDISLSS